MLKKARDALSLEPDALLAELLTSCMRVQLGMSE